LKFKIQNLKLKKILLDIFFPRRCVECNREGEYICNKCSLFITESLNNINGLTSVWDYDGVIRKALKEVKYRYTKDILNELIERAFKIILNDQNRFNGLLTFLINEKPVVTYVPMYKKKERARGFNQSEIIAQKIGKIFNLEVVELLRKTRETQSQTKLNREEREENVRKSFAEARPFPSQAPPQGTGLSRRRNVLLVDDIFTTGATMGECQKILKEMGVEKIRCFTLARTI